MPIGSAAARPADIDWDDEDEKTTVYEKGGDEDAARALLRSVPPPAAGEPAPRPATIPPTRARTPGARAKATVARLRPGLQTVVRWVKTGNRKLVLALAVSAVVAIAAAVLILAKPLGAGSLLVTVAGPNDKAIDALEIAIEDDTGSIHKQCSASPCAAPNLAAGLYLVKVKAAGYEVPTPEVISIDSGANVVKPITLTTPQKGTGVRVTAQGTGPFRLSIDGRDQGILPATVSDLEPGEHTLRVSDKKDRYEPYEKKVNLAKGEVLEVSATLKVVRGLAKITAGPNAEGARVALVSGNERRTLPRIPIAIEIKLDKPYTLVATKGGFETFELPLTFDGGEAEKTFEVALEPSAASEDTQPVQRPKAVAVTPKPPRTPAAPRPPSTRTSLTKAPEKKTSGGPSGTLSLNSIPVASVLVDGRAAGNTPTRWTGPPGTHTVTFSHPKYGRKSQTVTVKAGSTVVAAIRFP